MEIRTNLDKVLEVNLNEKVIVYQDDFLSGWGRAKDNTHYGVILTKDITQAIKNIKEYSKKERSVINPKVTELANTLKLSSVSYYNGYKVADIEPLKDSQ